jgi:hypothetical protein
MLIWIQTVNHKLGFRNAARTVVRYYAALRLSAGAATALFPVHMIEDRPPLVRTINESLVGGFDRRELIEHHGSTHVVTLPTSPTARVPQSRISIN